MMRLKIDRGKELVNEPRPPSMQGIIMCLGVLCGGNENHLIFPPPCHNEYIKYFGDSLWRGQDINSVIISIAFLGLETHDINLVIILIEYFLSFQSIESINKINHKIKLRDTEWGCESLIY